jgi:DNA repair protein RecO (recombination protein O)
MEWQDEAIIIGVRRHGESAVILEAMTRQRGRHLGLVRGGRSVRVQPVLQPGNSVTLTWSARLEDQLGHYRVEPGVSHAARLMASPMALYGMALAASHLRLLAEREPHPGLYEAMLVLISHLDAVELAPALLVRFEMAMLGELGFGLDLSACAVTGQREGLTHVSPRTGRAVCAQAAVPYAGRLLPLPAFLTEGQGMALPTPAMLHDGFALTGHFLQRDVWGPRNIFEPPERLRLIALLADTQRVASNGDSG